MPVIRRIPLWQNIPIYHWMKELQYSRCSGRQSPLRQLPELWIETVPPSQRKSATILSSKRRDAWDMLSMTVQTVSTAPDPICAQSPDVPGKTAPSAPGATFFASFISRRNAVCSHYPLMSATAVQNVRNALWKNIFILLLQRILNMWLFAQNPAPASAFPNRKPGNWMNLFPHSS